MTVIAYRDGILAADTLVVTGYARFEAAGRKVAWLHDKNGRAIALAAVVGDEVESAAFLQWADELASAPNGGAGALSREAPRIGRPTDGGVSSKGLLILRDAPNTVLIHTHAGMARRFLCPGPVGGYFADGAGAEVALGALYAGVGALTAVRAAILHSHGCGGAVDVVSFAEPVRREPGARS